MLGPVSSPLLIELAWATGRARAWEGLRWFPALLMADPIQVLSGLKW